ncbi:MAG TPA: 3-oxoacyl-[acyl-carrier-protein] reductase [Aggregatilineales bacterium]|nr:3-oxoacyl-[acyl-carrier-protein] reductase [Aggregatilineales bacterium]
MLTDRVAIVTGASRGIGRAVALELAKHGACIVVNYYKPAEPVPADSEVAKFADDAAGVVAEVEKLGSKGMTFGGDVSKLADADALVKAAVDHFGRLDILVNNAGMTRDNLIMMMKEDDWDTVINTNLKSVWNCARAAVKVMMRKRYGRIINMASVSGIAGQGGQTNYSASKAGVIGLTKALAREVASRQITVNAVAPGFIMTAMTAKMPPDALKKITDSIPLERTGTVEDIAYAVAFLASDEASYITGHVLSVDGGLVMG